MKTKPDILFYTRIILLVVAGFILLCTAAVHAYHFSTSGLSSPIDIHIEDPEPLREMKEALAENDKEMKEARKNDDYLREEKLYQDRLEIFIPGYEAPIDKREAYREENSRRDSSHDIYSNDNSDWNRPSDND